MNQKKIRFGVRYKNCHYQFEVLCDDPYSLSGSIVLSMSNYYIKKGVIADSTPMLADMLFQFDKNEKFISLKFIELLPRLLELVYSKFGETCDIQVNDYFKLTRPTKTGQAKFYFRDEKGEYLDPAPLILEDPGMRYYDDDFKKFRFPIRYSDMTKLDILRLNGHEELAEELHRKCSNKYR